MTLNYRVFKKTALIENRFENTKYEAKQAQLGVPHLESKTEPSVVKGGTPHRKNVYREGGTQHILSIQEDNRGGHRTSNLITCSYWDGDTAHNFKH